MTVEPQAHASPTTGKPSAAKAGRLPGLEALRFVAALCVLLLHARAVYGGRLVFARGYLGVDFFLMLSGYLMARTQEARLASGVTRPVRFMVNRYKRLWPTMAMGGLLGLPRLVYHSASALSAAGIAIANLLLIPLPLSFFLFPLNIPAWTIFFEMVANTLHVTLFWRFSRWLLIGALLILLPVDVWIAKTYGGLDVGAKGETFLVGLPRVAFAYLIGIALYRWWRDRPPVAIPPVLAIAVMPVLLAAGWWLGWQDWRFDLAFVLIVCPLMIAGALRLAPDSRLAGVSALVGQLSFPLFALQMPILEGLREFQRNIWVGGGAALAVGILGAVVTAWNKRRKDARKAMPG